MEAHKRTHTSFAHRAAARVLAMTAWLGVCFAMGSAQAADNRAGSSMRLTRGIHRLDSAESMRAGEITIGLAGEYFSTTGFFVPDDANTYHAQHVLVALALWRGLELGASWSMAANANDALGPDADRAGGDPTLSLKYTHAIAERLRVGTLVNFLFPTSPGGEGLKPSALSASAGAVASYWATPSILLAMNVGYRHDRSEHLFARELTRAQQFVAGVSGADTVFYGLGGSGMFDVAETVAAGGFAEIAGDFAPSATFAASPLRATAGLKALALAEQRLEIALGADVRLSGAPTGERELPGVPPWQTFVRLVGHLGAPPDATRTEPLPAPIDTAANVPAGAAVVDPTQLDSDEDSFVDARDPCPFEAEDPNGFEDNDGCPDGARDDDGDGIPSALDKCVDQPEDLDGFEDDDGCPDLDNDLDGVADADDQCPAEKETINGVDDWDGCPDEGEAETVYVENERIEIKTTILFEPDRAIVKNASKSLLDQVALQVLAHPEVKKIRVEGHTDSRGNAKANMQLSQERAEAVLRYLVSRGVQPHRLEAFGYGATRPLVSNATEAGRAKNRRVEFVIIE